MMKNGKLALVATLVIAGASFASGYLVGVEECDHPEWVDEIEAGEEPEISVTEDLMFKRNIVWNVLNKDFDRVPNSPERLLGGALALYLNPGSSLQAVNEGFLAVLLSKSFLYLSESDQQMLNEVLSSGSPTQRAAVLRLIMSFDQEANELVRSILDDTARIGMFMRGERIPLEGEAENEYWEDRAMSLPENPTTTQETETGAGCPAEPTTDTIEEEPEEERFHHQELQRDLDREPGCDTHDGERR